VLKDVHHHYAVKAAWFELRRLQGSVHEVNSKPAPTGLDRPLAGFDAQSFPAPLFRHMQQSANLTANLEQAAGCMPAFKGAKDRFSVSLAILNLYQVTRIADALVERQELVRVGR
jgi:hypothetical protein